MLRGNFQKEKNDTNKGFVPHVLVQKKVPDL